ncbi:hypothetical protein CDAR_544751 [Caerostris darwini]|uniref:Uncharacterized protein n=1 Tax=Caerostris darwini TaxID=1538125 RepID=A0AAV4TT03_9ARAC|nr:hypothetical protein CDAR_544751 [Caerostris darwini]
MTSLSGKNHGPVGFFLRLRLSSVSGNGEFYYESIKRNHRREKSRDCSKPYEGCGAENCSPPRVNDTHSPRSRRFERVSYSLSQETN